MKKWVGIITASVLCIALSGCCLSHDWQEASCETPKTCTKCEKTEGEVLGHSWEAATCETPETCGACGLTTGEPLTHESSITSLSNSGYTEACQNCGAEWMVGVEDWKPVAQKMATGKWVAKYLAMDGEISDMSAMGLEVTVNVAENGAAEMHFIIMGQDLVVQRQLNYVFLEEEKADRGALLVFDFWNTSNPQDVMGVILSVLEEPLVKGELDKGCCMMIGAGTVQYYCTLEQTE